MKVILLTDLPGVGNRYDVKDVPPGYVNNFLLPKKLALVANPQALAKVEKLKKEWQEKQKLSEEKIKASLEKLKDFILKIKEKANEKGHLFSGIDQKKIAELLNKEGIFLPAEIIKLEEPIKTIGEYEIAVGEKGDKLKLLIQSS